MILKPKFEINFWTLLHPWWISSHYYELNHNWVWSVSFLTYQLMEWINTKQNYNPWTSINNLWKSMKINEKSMKIDDNQWKSMKINKQINENQWKSMKIYEKLSQIQNSPSPQNTPWSSRGSKPSPNTTDWQWNVMESGIPHFSIF